MTIRIILLAGLAALSPLSATAETVALPVSHAGLDLASARGQAILERRIAVAARRICRTDQLMELAMIVASRRCYRETLARTRPQVDRAIALAQPSMRTAAR
jgi:UrcA family protein